MYKQLNILKISDIYHLELGKFMYQLYSDRLPAVFVQLFKKIKDLDKQKNQLIFFHVYLKQLDSSSLLSVESNFGIRLRHNKRQAMGFFQKNV